MSKIVFTNIRSINQFWKVVKYIHTKYKICTGVVTILDSINKDSLKQNVNETLKIYFDKNISMSINMLYDDTGYSTTDYYKKQYEYKNFEFIDVNNIIDIKTKNPKLFLVNL